MLISHLKEEQICKLFDVIAVAHSIVPKDVAVIPKFLNYLCRAHFISFSLYVYFFNNS